MDISFQLYSARNFTPWQDVIGKLAELGYTQVEGFGPVYDDPNDFKAALNRLGLSMPSGHFSIDMLENDLPTALEIASTLGIKRIYCPYLLPDQRPSDAAGWTNFARRLADVGNNVRAAGLDFGWHNHDFEFETLPDGSIPMQIILDEAPDNGWEADIAWITRGGANPMDWIARHGNRITAAHVKDIAPDGDNTDQDGWADVGHGIMDWPGLMTALRQAGCDLFVVEHDNPSDLDRFARQSITSIRSF